MAVDRDPVLAKPAVRHRDGAVRHGEDDVEEVLVVLPDLGDPALVLNIRPVTAGLEVGENARVIAWLAEDVQVLGGTADAGVGRHRIGAGEQERHAGFLQKPQALLVKGHGLGRRFKCGLGDGVRHAAGFLNKVRETEAQRRGFPPGKL
ncbi:hypothetical protein D3C72_1949710 [compost metagenome]